MAIGHTVLLRNEADTRPVPSPITASQTKTERFYRPELDALRFVAFLAVFLTHGIRVDISNGHLKNHQVLAQAIIFLHRIGAFGLSLFFFLSSFLITALLILEKERTGTVNLRSFYIRRILRIWPLYFIYIGISFVLGQYWSEAHFSVAALVSFYFLSTNWYVLVVGMLTPMVSFLWSISVEEQFYLVWPTLMRRVTTTGMRNLCIGLLALGLGIAGFLAHRHDTFMHTWFNSGVEMIFFASGGLMAIYFGLKRQTASMRKAGVGVLIAAASWLAANFLMGFGSQEALGSANYAVPEYALIAFGAASLLWAFLHMPRYLIRPEVVYLGRISYGLYVFHGFALLVGAQYVGPHLRAHAWLVVSFLLTVLLASLSYEFLEKPFLQLKHKFELVHSRAA